MKKIALLLLAAVTALAALADTHYKSQIFVGARGGVSMSMMSFSPSVKQSWNMGSTGAVSVRYTEEKLFGIVGEFGWVTRGWKENFEEHPLSYSRSLTYLNLPILTQIRFGSRRFKTFINLGPQFAYMIGSSISSDFDYNNPASVAGFPANRQTEQLKLDVKNKFDYGICAGIGFEFFVQPLHSVILEARYYYGLGNIFPARKADYFSASRNMSLEVTLGYSFRLK